MASTRSSLHAPRAPSGVIRAPVLLRCALPAALALLALSGCDANPGREKDARGPEAAAEQQETAAPPGTRAAPPESVPAGASSTARLPTFVNLDWDAFPRDRGPDYPVTGKERVVSRTGDDGNPGTEARPYRSIGKALSVAGPGDLIRVHEGRYAEGMPDDYRALVLEQENLVLTAAPGETVTVTPRSAEYKYGCAIQASHVTVNGINLEGFTYAMQIGAENETQKDVVISNLAIRAPGEGFNEGIIAYEDTRSKGFPTMSGLLIKNVSISGTALGVSCNAGPCTSWRLENVEVVGKMGEEGSGADAIAIENGDNMLFDRVDVSKASADGIDTKATRVVVWDSHVHDLGRNGVKLWHGGDVVNTLIHHTGADAAVVTKLGPRVRLLHCVVAYHNKNGPSSYNMTFGYDDPEAQEVEIIDSIIYNTSGGAYFNAASRVRIINSLFYGMDNGKILDKGEEPLEFSQGPEALGARGLGEGNVFADPKLDEAFHPRPGSPAIDRGKALEALYPARDARGEPRVKGGGPDLGPFEDF